MNLTRIITLFAVLSLYGLIRPSYADGTTEPPAWRALVVTHFHAGPLQAVAAAKRTFPESHRMLDVVADWIAQDQLAEVPGDVVDVLAAICDQGGPAAEPLRQRLAALRDGRTRSDDPRWVELYLDACRQRRLARLEQHGEPLPRIIFTKHYDMGGSHYAYTEGQSDAQDERHFIPGASLCLLELHEGEAHVRTLLEDPQGVIRDPDTSCDGQRILFSWKKSLDEDDYHLYEMNVDDGQIRQLTSGLGFADYEGAYLPDGNIVFNSTRCVQTVDCWWTEVSNLFTCDGDGRYLRQLSFDQVHTNFPTVSHDGRVIYTRWDYQDRGQIFPQGLFQMNPDGTGQAELYGNNSWFPTSILHARVIPGTTKIVCIFSGHHSMQKGWLGVLDPIRGRQENQGAQLIAPVRDTPAVQEDGYGQSGEQFQYPYPLSETEFLVTYQAEGASRFGIYWMSSDGRRELLVADETISCSQPVPLAIRPTPRVRPNLVDYRQESATIYLQDVCQGPGLAGVAREAIKSLRVVALEFRAAGIGSNNNYGPAGGALASTPISIEGAWDVKKILGTARVYEDGSACFTVPARTPLYFQALDEKGQMIQSMRSWMTLQPGETASCVGCHEHKNSAPPVAALSHALAAGPQPLEPFDGPPRGFSFIRELQPILDQHCVRCHYVDEPPTYASDGMRNESHDTSSHATVAHAEVEPAFSLLGTQTLDRESERKWSDSYKALADRRVVNWINIQSAPPMLPPYHAGAARSRLPKMLEEGTHYGVRLSRSELNRIAAWIDLLVPYCGDYTEAMNDIRIPRYRKFLTKRQQWHTQEAANIEAMLKDTH
ncbi:MAG: HzsA-related protein [Pirellulaceae bacterium]